MKDIKDSELSGGYICLINVLSMITFSDRKLRPKVAFR